eukprot:591372-Rhodomonas_salina.1
MIVTGPTHVFENPGGELESRLAEALVELLASFHRIGSELLVKLIQQIERSVTDAFPSQLC